MSGAGRLLAVGALARGRALAVLFSDGVRRLRETGELQALMARYRLGDWLSPR